MSLVGAISYAWEGRNVPLGHWMLGYINVPAFIALVAGTLLTVRLGVTVAHRCRRGSWQDYFRCSWC